MCEVVGWQLLCYDRKRDIDHKIHKYHIIWGVIEKRKRVRIEHLTKENDQVQKLNFMKSWLPQFCLYGSETWTTIRRLKISYIIGDEIPETCKWMYEGRQNYKSRHSRQAKCNISASVTKYLCIVKYDCLVIII